CCARPEPDHALSGNRAGPGDPRHASNQTIPQPDQRIRTEDGFWVAAGKRWGALAPTRMEQLWTAPPLQLPREPRQAPRKARPQPAAWRRAWSMSARISRTSSKPMERRI